MQLSDLEGVEAERFRGLSYQVTRVVDPLEGRLIVKRCLNGDSRDPSWIALQGEHSILTRLHAVPGCPRVVRFDPATRELAIADFDGVRLDQSGLMGNIDLKGMLAMSEALARAVAAMHGRGVVHGDINPASVLVRLDDLSVQVLDFDLATTFAVEHPEFDHPSRLLGRSVYLSPEQTGRMNRPVDYRTDIYSLGATLYALATGAPPFQETDILTLIHAHLARSPRSPQEQARWLPTRVSELILTLLAKEPDERYQSAMGLVHDLRRIGATQADLQALDRLALKEHDRPVSPRPPHRLYGRDSELKTLLSVFSSVTRRGVAGLFVAGYSGVGKTALIYEIHRPVTLANGLFISGKFEQFQRDRPYLALAQSLRQLCRLLLAEPADVVHQWRQRILVGVGQDAGVLVQVVPELRTLLGPQPVVPELGPIETQVRLQSLLVAFLRQIASPDHPLVLFIDDLQWADQASLSLIGSILSDADLNGLLLIGAYRDNEVDAAHPLTKLLGRALEAGVAMPILALDNLTVQDTAALLADMLRMPIEAVQTLAEAMLARTGGNPFFTIEFVHELYRRGELRHDLERGLWSWDTAAIFAHAASENVVDFLTKQLIELDAATSAALAVAACLGSESTLKQLTLAFGEVAPSQLVQWLTPALERGILVTPATRALLRADTSAVIRFCHDGMQQAVYQLADVCVRDQLHLDIARRFASAGGDQRHQFRAAEHYAAVTSLNIESDERMSVRLLFERAALLARQSGAFSTAERFLRLGIALLAADGWQSDQEAMFALHAELHLVLYSQSSTEQADAVYNLLEQHAASYLQLVPSACNQISSLSNRTRFHDAVALGIALADGLGLHVPLEALPPSLESELAIVYQLVAEGALEQLSSKPELVDENLRGVALLLSRLFPASFYAQPMLALWIPIRLLRLWIDWGYSSSMLSTASCTILATIALRSDYSTGYRIARTALEVGRAREGAEGTARLQHGFGLMNSHWFHSLEEAVEHAREAFGVLLRLGDMEAACFTFATTQFAVMETCAALSEMDAEVDIASAFFLKTGNRHAQVVSAGVRQLTRALEDKTERQGSFDDAGFSESSFLIDCRENPQALCTFHVCRAMAACLFDDEESMAVHVELAMPVLPQITGLYLTALVNLLHSLTLLFKLRKSLQSEDAVLWNQLSANQTWLAARAGDAPMNFGHLHDLVEAERLDIIEQSTQAFQMFEQAMRKAQGNHRPWHHALITERAGRCFMRHGLEHAARALFRRAHDLYQDWGAIGKARAMRARYPFVDESRSDVQGMVDHEALLRASQALATEISQVRLVVRVLELLAQLTGATNLQLLLVDGDGRCCLEAGLLDGQPVQRLGLAEAYSRKVVATSAAEMGLRALEPVVSDDAVIDARFADDPHFEALRQCSLLILPIRQRGRTQAVLILENHLVRGAFTPTRIGAATLLCGQLAISIENARVYQSLEDKVAERTGALASANATLENLGAIGREITGHLDAQAVFSTLNRHVHSLLDVTHFAIYLLDHASHTLVSALTVEAGQSLPVRSIALDHPTANLARCVRERMEIIIALDPVRDLTDPNLIAGTLPTLSLMFAPLMAGGRLLGAITVQSTQIQAYGEREAAIFRTLCAYGAIALANGEAYRAAEQALKASEALKSAIMDHATVALITSDANGNVVEFNPAAVAMFGHSRQQVLGRPFSQVIMPQRLRAGHDEGMLRVQHGQEPTILGKRTSLSALRSNGQEFPIEMLLWRTEVDDKVFYTSSIIDLSERLAADEKIAQQREALRQSEKLSAMGSLLAGVAHELNNPLAIVMGRASLLRDKVLERVAIEANDADIAGDLQRICDAAERCGRIVRTFLDMARQRPVRRSTVNLHDLIQASAEMLAYSYRSHGIELQLNLDCPSPWLQADGDQIGQIVLNLLVNAQQALAEHDGPRRVQLSTGLDAAIGASYVWMRVLDSGPGVSEGIRTRLFEPFFTTKTQTNGTGTGMGLSLSRNFAREHGGDLILQSTVPKGGAAFTLRLPLGGDPSSAVDQPAQADALKQASKRILVVDDEQEMVEVMRDMLQAAGYEVVTAESGQRALETLMTEEVAVILCDLHMPDMDGAAFWQLVCQRHPAQAQRIVFVTGDTLSLQVHDLARRSNCLNLEKPFSKSDLLDSVARTLSRASS